MSHLTLQKACAICSNPMRVSILRELAKQSPLPVTILAKRMGEKIDPVSKQLKFLRDAQLVEYTLGRLYQLSPPYQPQPGGLVLDLHHIQLVLAPSAAEMPNSAAF